MQPIPDSELVLNEDGSIYHLKLLPEQLAATVITVGDPGRVAQVSRHFDHIAHRVEKREFVTHTGRIGQKPITVISTGIGPDNIDIVLTELDALVNVDFSGRQPKTKLSSLDIIRIGTSGSLQADIPVDSFVISDYAIGLDNLLDYYPFSANATEQSLNEAWKAAGIPFPAHPQFVAGDPDLANKPGAGFHRGITLTCPGFYAPQGRNIRLKSKLDERVMEKIRAFKHPEGRITNLEMETAAIYGLSRMLGHRAVSCNAILANRAAGTFSKSPKKAVERLIMEVLDKLVG